MGTSCPCALPAPGTEFLLPTHRCADKRCPHGLKELVGGHWPGATEEFHHPSANASEHTATSFVPPAFF